MVFQFEYEKDGQTGYLNINVTETGQTFNYSEVGFGIIGEALIGWLPLQSGSNFKQDLPRYFGSTGGRQYNIRVPVALKTLITPIDGDNVLTLEKDMQYFGDYDAYNHRTPLDLYIHNEGVRKNVCSVLFGYEEIDDPEHPGQMIPSTYRAGLYSFATPVAEFPNPREYVGNLINNDKLPVNSYNENDKPCFSFWMIKVHDNIVGSVTYDEDFDVLIISYTSTGNSSVINPIYVDARLLKGAEIKPIPSKSTTQGNTPTGFRGDRNDYSDTDTISTISTAISRYANSALHGVHFYHLPTYTEYNEFCEAMWSDDTWAQFESRGEWNPVGGVLTLSLMPCCPDYYRNVVTEHIRSSGKELLLNDEPISAITPVESTAQLTSLAIRPLEYSGSFLDWTGYSKAYVRLPFIGIIPVDVSKIMNGGIIIKYNIDFVTGNCLAQIYTIPEQDVMGDRSNDYPYLDYGDSAAEGCCIMVGQYAGNCAHKLSYSGASIGGVNTIGSIVSGLVGAAAVVGGAYIERPSMIVGGIGAIGSAISNLAVPNTHPMTQNATPNADTMGMLVPALIIERPMDLTPISEDGKPTAYEFFNGRSAASGGTVKDYKGFDDGNGVFIQGVIHADALYATESEKREIEDAFAKGVYL